MTIDEVFRMTIDDALRAMSNREAALFAACLSARIFLAARDIDAPLLEVQLQEAIERALRGVRGER